MKEKTFPMSLSKGYISDAWDGPIRKDGARVSKGHRGQVEKVDPDVIIRRDYSK